MKTITFLFFALFCYLSVNAQWTNQFAINTPVATVQSNQAYTETISTNNGGTYVVFWKNAGDTINYDYQLRVQLIDANGNRQFGDNGMLVSGQIPMISYTVKTLVSIDDNNNLYIGASGTAAGTPAYMFKITPSGVNVWGQQGINIGSGYLVNVLPVNSGGVMVSWQDVTDYTTKLQKYDNNGVAQWSSPVTVGLAGEIIVPAKLFELSDGGIMEIYHNVFFSDYSYLYAQRYDSIGNPVWSNPVQLSNIATRYNKFYDYNRSGDTIYIGYDAADGLRLDSYVQRLNPDGSLPWGINGTDFDTDQAELEMNPKIAYAPNSPYIWAICTYANSSQGQSAEYVQKIDKITGTRLFTDDAKQVFPMGSQQAHAGDLQLNNNLPVFLVSTDTDPAGMIYELSVVELDSLGDFVNSNSQYTPIATAVADKGRIHFVKSNNNQVVAIFNELKSDQDSTMIYAQNYKFKADGVCMQPTGLTVTEIAADSVKVSWTAGGSETSWEVIYGESGFDVGITGDTIIVNNNPEVTLTNLQPETEYEVYVKSICSSDNSSELVGPQSFQTSLGIVDQIFQNFKFYPNPVKTNLFLKAHSELKKITLFNLRGQEIISIEPNTLQSYLKMGRLQPGIYIMKVNLEDHTKTFKIIKK